MADEKSAPVTKRGTLRPVLILLFSSAWLVLLIAGWVSSRFAGPESASTMTIERIRWSTGTWQRWDMFRTIPNLRDYQLELVGETSAGGEKTFGAIVPELETFDGTGAVRYHYALNRILNGNPEFLDGYVAQSAIALRKQDPELERFSIKVISQPTRALDRSREDGELWTTLSEQLGPFPASDD